MPSEKELFYKLTNDTGEPFYQIAQEKFWRKVFEI